MKGRFTLLAAVAVLLIFIVGPVVQAQPLKIGVIVRVEAPDALDPLGTAVKVVRQVERALGDTKVFALVNQDLLNLTQKRLDIHLSAASSLRDMHAVAESLHLDRLIIIQVKVSDRFEAELTALVYNPHGDQVYLAAFNARGPHLDEVLEHAVGGLLDRIFPQLK